MRSLKYWWRRILCWLDTGHFYVKRYSQDGPPYYCHSTCVFCGHRSKEEISWLVWCWYTLTQRTRQEKAKLALLITEEPALVIYMPRLGDR